MKAFTIICLVSWISVISGCASSPSKSLLEERAGYGINVPPLSIGGPGDVQYVPMRIPERVIVAWLHAHELPSKDYFWGSWVSILVAPESWEMKKVDLPQNSDEKLRTQPRPTKKPPKRSKVPTPAN